MASTFGRNITVGINQPVFICQKPCNTLLADYSDSNYWRNIQPVITDGKIPQYCFLKSPQTLLTENSASNISDAHITEGLESASNAYY
jgi:hypothetical protein